MLTEYQAVSFAVFKLCTRFWAKSTRQYGGYTCGGAHLAPQGYTENHPTIKNMENARYEEDTIGQ